MTHPSVMLCQVTTKPLVSQEHELAVSSQAAGAIVTFVGAVRDHDQGRAVSTLTYEAHPTAPTVLNHVLEQFAHSSEAVAIAVSHRVGALAIGDAALVVSVSAAHRGTAFTECARIVDLVKAELPVWKHQVFTDGTDEWVNCA